MIGTKLRARTRSRNGGFTLIELSIVVVIVAILAVLGIVGYRRYRAHVRMNEATTMISAIRVAQVQYKTEAGIYANVSKTAESFYPAETPGAFVTTWGGNCSNCVGNDVNGWKKLPVAANGPVMFGYATVASVGGSPIPAPVTNGFALGGELSKMEADLKPADPYFLAVAKGDYDGDGIACSVMGLSHTKELIVSNDSE